MLSECSRTLRGISGLAVLMVLACSTRAGAQCASYNLSADSAVYSAGDELFVDMVLMCDGPGTCGPCEVTFHLDTWCEPVLEQVTVNQLPIGSFEQIVTFVQIPPDQPPGCYRLYAELNCEGCTNLCNVCCDCCPPTDTDILIRNADLNDNGSVDFADMLVVIVTWGPCSDCCVVDLDGDGTVGFSDLVEVIDQWG